MAQKLEFITLDELNFIDIQIILMHLAVSAGQEGTKVSEHPVCN